MLFNSVSFGIFFVIVATIYFVIPKKIRYIWLLISSYYFYMQWNKAYVFLLFGCTLLTYLCAGLIEYSKSDSNKIKSKILRPRNILIVCVTVCLCVLGYYKYSEMIIKIINAIMGSLISFELSYPNILLPVGISFFTLQSLGYLIDVYRGDIESEHNFLRYALFVSFFPQLVAGPIERSKNLMNQLKCEQDFSLENVQKGFVYMLYGLFLKVMIADRCAVFVDTVYDSVVNYPGFYVVVASILFSVQIYCDFYGYSVIAKGAARVFGIELMDNFMSPYFSKSIKEFWLRWHISLSSWFKDYLYIPLGGNRKGKLRKQINLLIVFLVSGLWHGASISFVVWGGINAIYQIIGEYKNSVVNKIKGSKFFADLNDSDDNRFSKRLFKVVATFILVDIAWIFFRAGGMDAALLVFKAMLSTFNVNILFDGSLYGLGIDKHYMFILFVSISVLGIVDYLKYKKIDVMNAFLKQGYIFKLLVITAMIFGLFLFGCYGELYDVKQFIYFQF